MRELRARVFQTVARARLAPFTSKTLVLAPVTRPTRLYRQYLQIGS